MPMMSVQNDTPFASPKMTKFAHDATAVAITSPESNIPADGRLGFVSVTCAQRVPFTHTAAGTCVYMESADSLAAECCCNRMSENCSSNILHQLCMQRGRSKSMVEMICTLRPQTDSTPTRPSPSANASRSSGKSTGAGSAADDGDGVPWSAMSSMLLHPDHCV